MSFLQMSFLRGTEITECENRCKETEESGGEVIAYDRSGRSKERCLDVDGGAHKRVF